MLQRDNLPSHLLLHRFRLGCVYQLSFRRRRASGWIVQRRSIALYYQHEPTHDQSSTLARQWSRVHLDLFNWIFVHVYR